MMADLRFPAGSACGRPFADRGLDVLCAHDLLPCLDEPARARREMNRVAGKRAIAATQDPDSAAFLSRRATPGMEAFSATSTEEDRHGDRFAGRKLYSSPPG